MEAGGRGVDAGQDDGQVGGGADLRAGLRGVAARGGDDDGDRLCFCTTAAERADRVGQTVARVGRDIGEAVNAGQRGAQVDVAEQPDRERLGHAGEVAVGRVDRVLLVDGVVGDRVVPRGDADHRGAVVGDGVLDADTEHVVGG